MEITPGKKFGPYEIIAPIGAGGMGEVWKARDTRLDRSVAIKLLPAAFASDPQRRARFEREARTISQLNHPHICTLHDVGSENGTSYLVMELVEGETLADRLSRGPMPIADVLRHAAEIADALDRAHKAGVIHRDLKPANVMITRTGAKLLDFGLARPRVQRDADPHAPTLQQALTSEGVVVGTLPYMAPEQLQEKEPDPRTDVFAFGAVLYEMITGRRAFTAENSASLIAKILEYQPPPPSALQTITPPLLEDITLTCLHKDPDSRFQSLADVAHQLRWLAGGGSASAHLPESASPSHARLWIAIAAATAIAATAFAGWVYRSTRRPTAPRTAFAQLTVESGQEREPSISPDGKTFAFVKDVGGQSDIFLQRLDGKSAINLTADNASNDHEPAFSPDGGQIAFRSEREGGGIFIMGATGESVRRLTDKGFDPAWSPDGRTIVYSSQPAINPASVFGDSNLFVVDVASGASRVLLRQADVMQPSWSPHGDRIAFWIARKGRRDIMTIDRSGDPASVQDITADDAIDWSPMWSADGRYLYFSSDRDGTMNLWRVAVDEKTGKRDGELEPVRVPTSYAGFFSTSHDGTAFTYQSSVVATELLRVTFDRKTTSIAADPAPLFTGSTSLRQSMPSPDGKWIVYTNLGPQEDVFLMSSDGKSVRQITNDRFFDRGASWWPDGSRVIFYSSRAGVYDAYSIRPDGSGLTKITSAPEGVNYPRVSRDGRRIAYIADDGTGSRIATLDAAGRVTGTEKMAEAPTGGFRPQAWSPNGKWIAGASWLPTAPIALHLYSVADRRAVTLPIAARAAEFLDDSHLLFVDNQDRVGITDLTGSAIRIVGTIPQDTFKTVAVRISDNAETIIVTRTRVEGDIWKMTVSR